MLLKLVIAALLSLALPFMTLPQAAGDLAQKVESRLELTNDYQILNARVQNNQREYSMVQAFCRVRLTEPALSARSTYCAQKTSEFNGRDADLRAQAQKLALRISELDAQIQQLQKARPPR